MRVIVTTLLAAAFAAPVGAQPGSGQQTSQQQTGDAVSGTAGLGYLATSGNTESTNANASFELLYERPAWSHEFALSAVTASREGVTTAEAYTGAYEARRDWSEKSYLVTAFDWRTDRFSAFDHQMSETVGYGRRLIDNDTHALNVEGGVGARQAERQNGIEEDDEIARLSLDYTLSVNDTTEFSQDFVTESGQTNTSVESVSALRVQLFGGIGLSVSHRIRYNSDVQPDTEDTDQFTSISLEYEF